jgi:PPOX class probable F420-dependent enzyme
VQLDEATCWERLETSDHGVLGTVHPQRGVDLVPVVFVVWRQHLVVPIDAVKAKSGARLQRLVNVEHDPRCSLLVEHYADDWQQLWWVRVHARAAEAEPTPELLELLAARHEPYRAPGSVTGLLVLEPDAVQGWSAT